MIYQVVIDNFRLSDGVEGYLDGFAKKFDRYLPAFAQDLPILRVFIRAHSTRKYFDGTIELFLPKTTLAVRFKAPRVEEAIKLGFGKLKKELRDYKGKHFEEYG